MRKLDGLVLAGAVCILGAAAAYRARSAQPPASTSSGRLEITRMPVPAVSPTHPLAERACIRFAPKGADVHGIAAAVLYPEEDARPAYARGQNVVAVQGNGALRLGGWMRRRHPQVEGDTWLLHFALWCTVEGRPDPVWWTGWARLSLTEIAVAGCEVVPARGASVEVFVRTREGQGIPGVSVAVDPVYQQPGLSLQHASTGEDGRVTLIGLDEARDWAFSLPFGAGPSRKPVRGVWKAGSEQRVELVVDLPGRWEWKPIHVVPMFRGATLTVEAMQGGWPTASWIGAGRLPTVCYAMWPAGQRPPKLVAKFAGCEPHEFAVDKPARCRLVPAPKKKKEQKREGS